MTDTTFDGVVTATPTPPTHVDLLIIGAGISGIGTACHLKSHRPGTSFAILEGRDRIGGTWSLFRYPGIRSDSDMSTFGFRFNPWTHRKVIADSDLILRYLQQTVGENRLDEYLHFGLKVVAADFDADAGIWTVTTQPSGSTKQARFTSRSLFFGTGYYDYEKAFIPEFDGVDDFEGPLVHPQFWPEDLDYVGKRVVVVGSGATAITLIPAMADQTSHITMLQRSPGYVVAIPAADPIANALNKMLGPKRAHRIIRRKNIAMSRGVHKACRRAPTLLRKLLIAQVRRQLPSNFDVNTHFTPRYDPWDQRLSMSPNGDLFKAISSGKASVVTDRIARFTKAGIELESGQELTADIVVTATGLTMLPFGGIALSVDLDHSR